MKNPLFAAAAAGCTAFFAALKKDPGPGPAFGCGVGDLRYHHLSSRYLKSGNREVVIYLPPSYWQSDRRYPVLYMHDGQNLFDASTGYLGKEWYVDEKVEYLIQKRVIEEVIVVGIYHGGDARSEEYTWTPVEGRGGQGRRYADFLVRELKPLIDRTYRTLPEREHTAVLGSSLGGVISLHLARHYPKVFGKIGLMSPALNWDDLLREAPKLSKNTDCWLDMGTEEGLVEETHQLAEALEKRLQGRFMTFIHEGARHDEEAWAARVHAPLILFFGARPKEEQEALIHSLMHYENWEKL